MPLLFRLIEGQRNTPGHPTSLIGPTLRLQVTLDAAGLNSLRSGFLVLCQKDNENSDFKLGAHIPWPYIIGERVGAPEALRNGLETVLLFGCPLLLESALAGDGQCTLLRRDLHIFLPYLRQLGRDLVLIVVFANVYDRSPFGQDGG